MSEVGALGTKREYVKKTESNALPFGLHMSEDTTSKATKSSKHRHVHKVKMLNDKVGKMGNHFKSFNQNEFEPKLNEICGHKK